MKHKIAVLIALFIMTFPAVASAHSALVSAVPDGTSDEAVSELVLTFNQNIEPLSSVKVTNAAGEEQPVADIVTDGKVITARLETPLTNGTYQVDWRIISADGHPVSGSYSLEVKIPEPQPEPEPSPTGSSALEPSVEPSPSTPSQDASDASSAPAGNAGQAESDGDSAGPDFSSLMLIAAAVLVISAVAVTVWKRRKT